ncbi:hypothetical protein BDK51DRAFT_51988 [Blyttiomyces helicus]|uniref:Uncharacterized protein n=1 Tax=Blyttiomyces helicus TaxID=388810 RepID=A0A4P9WLT2_9FUNG|nr:hypothetical protein BDK51DRAFT_51988 [Blyttiomyces helicus]|eukprot:RKO92100.1 hypothetical protein BDK51DRAFT_51988 [Blyttiomyces helicus]
MEREAISTGKGGNISLVLMLGGKEKAGPSYLGQDGASHSFTAITLPTVPTPLAVPPLSSNIPSVPLQTTSLLSIIQMDIPLPAILDDTLDPDVYPPVNLSNPNKWQQWHGPENGLAYGFYAITNWNILCTPLTNAQHSCILSTQTVLATPRQSDSPSGQAPGLAQTNTMLLQAYLDCTNRLAVGNPQPTWSLLGFFLGTIPTPEESDTQTDLAKLSWTEEQLCAKCLASATVYTLRGAGLAYTPSFRASEGHISRMITSPLEIVRTQPCVYEEMFEDRMTEIFVLEAW